jgi:HlyD family secretion protein
MKKGILIFLLIFLFSLFWFWGKDRFLFYTPQKAQAQYRFTEVEKRDMLKTVSATGTVSAVVTVEVGSEVSGQIEALPVDFNSPVRISQIIARIDQESYATLVRQAQAELDIAEAQLGILKTEILRYEAELENAQANQMASRAKVKKAKVTVDNARITMERQQSLVEQDFISRNDYDLAKTAYEEAHAQLEQSLAEEKAAKSKVRSSKVSLAIARASIEEAEAQIRLKEAALDRRKVDLENTIIRSPVDGVVIDRSVDVGQTVAASLQAPVLFTIAQDLHEMQVSASIDEADIGQIKQGQSAQFTVDAFGTRKYSGNVSQVRKLGQTVQNVVTYEVIISAENQDLSLMPGMTADVTIELLKKPQVLTVANAALRFTPPHSQPTTTAGALTSPGIGLQAGLASAGGPPGGGRFDLESRMRTYTERLHLTETQKGELKRLFQQMGQKMRTARSNPNAGPRGGAGAMRDKIRKEAQLAVKRLLKPEQQALYEEMLAQEQPKYGTLWRLDEDGDPEAIRVILGSSDSTHTEISGRGIEEGVQVISGIN